MANIKSSKKHAIISEKKRKYNFSKRSAIKTFIKKVYFFIKQKNKEKANETFCILQSIIDRYALKGILHVNKAARHKSILTKYIKNIV
ncbi:30S ribosomal protein S20 [Buchnera aphidicola (Cinara kochiana kochiana)]|uniref:Small ribosomal subunit protein bS20 n=1 Tax=Buchnera aphidicola (Cinara kochiana kochiana) TaxID=2518976 RepID=A0A451D5A0_9GAMM|nr:30S ribosomal protein S20 [Buchnera aphidicola]VFP81019.1 30S ribosomal protein S20 [Buchnera aphidicola (Cinara kochiana kochiana)]